MWDGQANQTDELSLFDRLAVETKHLTTCASIRRHVERHFNLDRDELLTRSRRWRVSHPRQIAMALCYTHFRHRLSYDAIGRFFGGLHYSTAIFACQKYGIDPDPVQSERGRRARTFRIDAQIRRFAA